MFQPLKLPLLGTLLTSLLLLAACAPKAQASFDLLSSPADTLSFQTLQAPFYRDLAELGITIETHEAYHYYGDDGSVPRQLVRQLREEEGFCRARPSTYREGDVVLELTYNNQAEVRGVIYDLSNKPRLTYATFEGRSYRALSARKCNN